MDLTTLADVKLALNLTTDKHDAWISGAITQFTGRLEGELERSLEDDDADITELHCGNGLRHLMVDQAPIASITSIELENETAVDTTPAEDQVRFGYRTITLLQRTFTRSSWPNVTIKYKAGYTSQAALSAVHPDIPELIRDTVRQAFVDQGVARDARGAVSLSQLNGGSAGFAPSVTMSAEWKRARWDPVVKRHSLVTL